MYIYIETKYYLSYFEHVFNVVSDSIKERQCNITLIKVQREFDINKVRLRTEILFNQSHKP